MSGHSAMVVLRPASGDAGSVTSETVASAMPEPSVVAAVTEAFEALGFTVGPAVALSFSIEGSDDCFDEVLPSLRSHAAGPGVEVEASRHDLDAALGPLARHVAAVVVGPEPEFGPGGPWP